MTIKPVIAPPQKRVVTTESEKKDTHTHVTHSGQVGGVVEQPSGLSQQQNVRSAASHAHRNVVIDGHGQSPQRRGEVFDDISRHRRSPHKSSRSKRRDHHEHHKRDRVEREKHASVSSNVVNKCNSPHGVAVGGVVVGSGGNSPISGGGKSPEHMSGLPVVLGCQSPKTQATVTQAAANLLKATEDTYSGYNSGDEHLQPKEGTITVDEWQQRDEQFAKCMTERGYIVKPVEEDGACLFRAISLQIYGDEEMHDVIRQHTMDYIYKNREYFCHFVTEDINSYIKRKRRKDSHGNHIEIQAMSEIYSRPVEVYCYKPTPINIFNSEQKNNGYAPLRLSYQRGSHYNAIIDPYNATVGVGLGLAGYKPDLQTKEAARLSEQLEIEQTMFEDKLKTTDWEATNEAIEEQIARESYLQWCRDNLHKSRSTAASTSATVTSAEAASDAEASPSKYSMQRGNSSVCSSSNNSNSNSTITTTATGTVGMTVTAAGSVSPNNLEHSLSLSSKSFSALAHNLKKDASTCELGFESDDTDMSSTSSMGGGGNASPSSALHAKKTKTRGNTVRGSKKRRREQHATLTAKSNLTKEKLEGSARKSPKRDLAATVAQAVRAHTPEIEQQPSTSKQSHTPEKHNEAKTSTPTNAAKKQQCSSFYQELLEASYATQSFGQQSESEMLQQAIRMSTQDYIEDQKRKYLYGPYK